MRSGLFLSASLHAAVVVIAWTGIPWLFADIPELDIAISVQIVALDEAAEEVPEAAPETASRKVEPPPPPPPPPEMAPLPQPEPVTLESPPPEPVAPEPPEAPKAEETPPEPEPQVTEAQPRLRPKLKTKPQPPEPDLMASVLRTIEELEQKPVAEQAPTAHQVKQQLTIDDARRKRTIIDAVRDQVSICWNPPVGAQDAEDLVVEIHIALTPDGRVRAVQAVDQYRLSRDPFFRAAAESARRAVLKCEPLDLPLDSYNLWKTMMLVFNPKEMLGT
jgi:type IV secretory pathway VirB10-like protein